MKKWERDFIARLTRKPLRLGDPDAMPVRRWRARLRAKGWTSVPRHGPFDARLRTATRVAQMAAGVTADGVVGPITWKGVGKLKRQPPAPKPPAKWKPRVIDCRDGRQGFPRHASRRWGRRSILSLRHLCGHYTGNLSSFLADARFHVYSSYLTRGGAPAIAYTIGVERNGDIRVFNDWHDITWHCDGGKNTSTLGIVFLGDARGPTTAQKRALKWLIPALRNGTFKVGRETWPRMNLPLTSHRHITSTSCPGDKGERFFRSLGRFDTNP